MLRKGNQFPTFSTVGDWFTSHGEIAASMFTEYGVRFYESQEYELNLFLARKEDGSFAAKTICISKPRQNGKSYGARFYAIWMAAIEGKRVLFSAHHGKTVRKMFKEIRNFIENTPDFYSMLKPKNGIYSAAGTEGIYFADYYDDEGNFHEGGLIEFQTRTNSSARGETYQVIIVDEAQELTAEQLEALKPTTIAADDAEKVDSDPQMIYLGTPPNDKCVGTEFRRWHEEAHEGRTSIWWMEWAVEELPQTTDKAELMELVYETNPAMGYRIKESTMVDVMDTMSAEGFARECLGWWSKTYSAVQTVIKAEDWNACKVDNPKAEGLLAYGVKFSADGMIGTLSACYRPQDDSPFVYVVASRDMSEGLSWFVDNLIERKDKAACVMIDGKSNAENLRNKLIAAGFSKKAVHCLGTQEAITANSAICNAVKERELRHYGQEQLNNSATKCARRDIGRGGGFGFDSTEDADATLIESCAAALYGAMTTKRKPGRKAKVRC